MLDRCCGLETRSAALYRSFAAAALDQPDLCMLWTALAREEDEHARLLDAARGHLPTAEARVTRLSGRWDEVVHEVEAKLSEAERLATDAGTDQRLAAALALEMTEIEPCARCSWPSAGAARPDPWRRITRSAWPMRPSASAPTRTFGSRQRDCAPRCLTARSRDREVPKWRVA
jgi:hypothetical protein